MDAQPLFISLHDESAGYEISPDRVPLAVLRTFVKDVEEFLRGDGGEVDLQALDVGVVKGSLAIQTAPVSSPGLLRDLLQLAGSEHLDGLDRKRREVVERWQKLARGARHCVYRIAAPGIPRGSISISAATDFHADDADQWVQVERYLQGEIVEIGGLKKVNAHIRLPDGTLIPVESDREFFRSDTVNRLYKVAMARISAEYNVVTRKYRNARLLGFEEHQQTLDEAQLRRLTERGAKAWRDVPNAGDWVDSLREVRFDFDSSGHELLNHPGRPRARAPRDC